MRCCAATATIRGVSFALGARESGMRDTREQVPELCGDVASTFFRLIVVAPREGALLAGVFILMFGPLWSDSRVAHELLVLSFKKKKVV